MCLGYTNTLAMDSLYREHLVIVLVLLVFSGAQVQGNPHETKLFEKLFANYDKNVRPAKKASDTLDVKFGISLQEIVDLDPQNGKLDTNLWLNYEWYDYRLAWNESEFDDIKSIRVEISSVWIPDIQPYNGQVTYLSNDNRIVVYSNGLMSWVPPIEVKSSCSVSLTRFPYDQQKCSLKFGSWTYNGEKINITLMWDELDITTYAPSPAFDLLKQGAQRNEFKYPCCPEPYIDVTFTLELARRTGSASHMLVAPSITLALFLPVLFLLPPGGSGKLQLGAGFLITHAVLLNAFMDMVPIDHYTLPLLGMYHIINIVLVCFAVACGALVKNIWAKSERNVQMPHLIKTVFLGIFGRLLCVRHDDMLSVADSHQGQVTSDSDHEKVLEGSTKSMASAQWRQLAVIMDRMCFIIFLVIALITIIRFASF